MIQDNYQTIRQKISQCAANCNRDPNTIQLVAVSKKKESSLIQQVFDCGQRIFGENYLQEAAQKIPDLPPSAKWHFIGHLQSNKAKQAVSLFDVIETVDSLKLAKLIDKHANTLGKSTAILLQINIGREQQKAGVLPEEAESLLKQITSETKLQVLGLMVIPPFSDKPEVTRPFFRETRKLAEEFARKQLFTNNENVVLSMGMSADFHVAIEEGATHIRIGTALFGARDY